jgi:hypothetical protein
MEGQRKVHLNSFSPDTQNTFTLDVQKFKWTGAVIKYYCGLSQVINHT